MTAKSNHRRRHRRAISESGGYRSRPSGAKRKRPSSIPLQEFDRISEGSGDDIAFDKLTVTDDNPFHSSSSLNSMIVDLGDVALDDSFQREVAEKTQRYFVGRQEAEIEVYIDRIIAKQGNKDKALLYVVENIDTESRLAEKVKRYLVGRQKAEVEVQMLVNTLLHRGANPSASNRSLRTPLHFAVEKNFRGVCSKLLENDAWPNARDRDGNMPYTIAYQKGNDEVASMLILYMPNIDVRKLYTSDGTSPAEFSFHTLLELNMEKTVLAVLDCMIDHVSPSGHVRVYYHVLEADNEGRSPEQKGFDRKSKSPLQRIAKGGNKTVVYHDVVRLLIRRKWKEYARLRFQVNSLLYFITLLGLTYSAIVGATSENPLVYDKPLQIGRAVCEVWSVGMVILTLTSEINQFRKHRLEYFQDAFNWVDLSSSLLLIIVLPLRFTEKSQQWPVFAVGFLLWTLRIFKYAAVFRQTGAYAQILWRILAHDFIQFTIVFTVILLAFSGSLLLSLRGEDSFTIHDEMSSFWRILFLGIRILIEAERVIEYTELGPMSCILMVLFLFTICVVLLNILIAQLSDTYQHVQQDAQRGLEVNRAWIVARVELNSLYVGKGHRTTHYKEYEDIEDIRVIMERWENPPISEMNKNVQDIWDSLQSHKLNILTVNNRLARQETALTKIENQLDAIFEITQKLASLNKDDESDRCTATGIEENTATHTS